MTHKKTLPTVPSPALETKSGPLFRLALSSRALFRLEEEDAVFRQPLDEGGGVDAYRAMQARRMGTLPEPGTAFPLVRKLTALNRIHPGSVHMLLLSRSDAVSGIRTLNAAKQYDLDLESGAFRCGGDPTEFIHIWNPDLFLSAHESDVSSAMKAGVPSGLVWQSDRHVSLSDDDEIRVAFDGDAVLFDATSENLFQEMGGTSSDPAVREKAVWAWRQHEHDRALDGMGAGPMAPFLEGLQRLQKAFPGKVRTGIFTARDAGAVERCLRTLWAWGVTVDEAFPLGGVAKGPFLAQWKPDLFLDDQPRHCCGAADLGIPSVRVLSQTA